MPGETIRILSDIHYGEHASRVRSLGQLRPLFDGATRLVVNGDTLDTRPGPDPERTARTKEEVRAFFGEIGAPVTFLTGNHDPDFSANDLADLADGRVLVTHGDILFADIVPWGQDSPLIRDRLHQEQSGIAAWEALALEERLAIHRKVAATIPQRHQAETDFTKYVIRFLKDTIWPPSRIATVIRAWKAAPQLAAALLKRDRPAARFAILGHTHRRGIWRVSPQATVINTGAFCWPSGSFVVDLLPSRLLVRRVDARQGEFRLGTTVAEFGLEP